MVQINVCIMHAQFFSSTKAAWNKQKNTKLETTTTTEKKAQQQVEIIRLMVNIYIKHCKFVLPYQLLICYYEWRCISAEWYADKFHAIKCIAIHHCDDWISAVLTKCRLHIKKERKQVKNGIFSVVLSFIRLTFAVHNFFLYSFFIFDFLARAQSIYMENTGVMK